MISDLRCFQMRVSGAWSSAAMRPATVFFPESPGFLLAGYNINHVISMSYIIIENSMAALIIKLLGQKVGRRRLQTGASKSEIADQNPWQARSSEELSKQINIKIIMEEDDRLLIYDLVAAKS